MYLLSLISNDIQNDTPDNISYYYTNFKSLIPNGKEKQFLIFVTLKRFKEISTAVWRALCVPAGEEINQWQRWLLILFPLEYITSRLITCINNKLGRGYFGGRFVDHKLINRELFCFSFHIRRRYVQDYQDITATRIEGIFKEFCSRHNRTVVFSYLF